MRYKRLKSDLFTDYIFANTTSTWDNNEGGQVYTSSTNWIKIYPTSSRGDCRSLRPSQRRPTYTWIWTSKRRNHETDAEEGLWDHQCSLQIMWTIHTVPKPCRSWNKRTQKSCKAKHGKEVHTNALVGLLRRITKWHPVIHSAARRNDPWNAYQGKHAEHFETGWTRVVQLDQIQRRFPFLPRYRWSSSRDGSVPRPILDWKCATTSSRATEKLFNAPQSMR